MIVSVHPVNQPVRTSMTDDNKQSQTSTRYKETWAVVAFNNNSG